MNKEPFEVLMNYVLPIFLMECIVLVNVLFVMSFLGWI